MVLQANDLHVPHLLASQPQETGHIEQRGRFACSSAAAIEQSTQKGGGRGYGNPVSGNDWIMIRFGLWSTILLVGSIHGVIVAMLLPKAGRNRVADRFLAALLLAVVLLITPFTIGYAGLYDAYPWLSFAPFFWQLGFGPLLYFYVRRLATDRLPTGWAWHFVPMALQCFYYIFAFCLPMARKLSWNHGGHTQCSAAHPGDAIDSVLCDLLAGFGTILSPVSGMAGKLSRRQGGIPAAMDELDLPLIGQFPEGIQPDAGLDPDVRVTPRASDIASHRDPEMEAAKALML